MVITFVANGLRTPLRGVVQDKAPLAGPRDRAFVVQTREHGGRCAMPRRVGCVVLDTDEGVPMVPRRQHTTRKHIRLTREGQTAVKAWTDQRGVSFSAALESLATLGLGQSTDQALAPALVSVVRHEVQRRMHRLASLLASNAIEAGVSARLSGAALKTLRPKDYDAIKRAARIDTVHSLPRRDALQELSSRENTYGDSEC